MTQVNAETIIGFRKKKGISQHELAELIGVHWRTIQNYESGAKIPESKIRLFTSLFQQVDAENKLEETETAENPMLGKYTISNVVDFIMENRSRFLSHPVFRVLIDHQASKKVLKMMEEIKNTQGTKN